MEARLAGTLTLREGSSAERPGCAHREATARRADTTGRAATTLLWLLDTCRRLCEAVVLRLRDSIMVVLLWLLVPASTGAETARAEGLYHSTIQKQLQLHDMLPSKGAGSKRHEQPLDGAASACSFVVCNGGDMGSQM
jgi:hypothetical protein